MHQLKTLERQPEEAEELFGSLILSSPTGVYIVQDGKFRLVNPQFEKFVGYSEDELLGMDSLNLVLPEDRSTARDDPQQMLNGERRLPYEYRIVTKTGEIKRVMKTVASIQYGGRQAALANIVDITQGKRAEDALRALNESLEQRVLQRTAELERSNQELERSNRELEQFAYVASHDLQEPLRAVTSHVQLLARRYKGKLDADADDSITYALDGANRMRRLINDLLAYSHVGTRKKPFKAVSCSSILRQILANLQTSIEESHAVITHGPLPTVSAEPLQLTQLFQNLIGNAMKFRCKEPPQVHISALQKTKEWVFSVRDNGIGISPGQAARIFVIFQRLHTKSEYPGTGIGLAICKKIVERHGGRIWVQSEPGKGATFCFTIPRREGGQL